MTFVYRGIPKRDWLKDKDPDTGAALSVSMEVFQPIIDQNRSSVILAEREKEGLEPGLEASINWEGADAVSSLKVSPQGRHGVAQVDLEGSQRILAEMGWHDVKWERRPIASNKLHGNIVYPMGMPAHKRDAAARKIAGQVKAIF